MALNALTSGQTLPTVSLLPALATLSFGLRQIGCVIPRLRFSACMICFYYNVCDCHAFIKGNILTYLGPPGAVLRVGGHAPVSQSVYLYALILHTCTHDRHNFPVTGPLRRPLPSTVPPQSGGAIEPPLPVNYPHTNSY